MGRYRTLRLFIGIVSLQFLSYLQRKRVTRTSFVFSFTLFVLKSYLHLIEDL